MIFVCVLVGAVVRVLTLEERVSVPLTIIDETRWCCMEGTEAVGMFIHSFLPADIASVIKLQGFSLALSILLSNRRPIWGHLCLCMSLNFVSRPSHGNMNTNGVQCLTPAFPFVLYVMYGVL
jgi:hypothetical protein